MRKFDSGATRDDNVGKLDYEGFLSPLVLRRFAQYMNKHRLQADNKLRDSDNWQKGIPFDVYMKSKFRHFMDVWLFHRGLKDLAVSEDIEEALCAELFNDMGLLHEVLKQERKVLYVLGNKEKKMICFLDLDGVLVDFMKGVHEFYDLPYSFEDYSYEFGKWDTCPPSACNMAPQEFWDGLNEDFWANLPWMKDGRGILEIVEEAFGKENICLLTVPTGPCCAQGKIRWIRKFLPEYGQQFLIGSTKKHCVSDNAVLIDDSDEHVEEFIRCGGYGILVPRPWNRMFGIRDYPLKELRDKLRELKESSVWKD